MNLIYNEPNHTYWMADKQIPHFSLIKKTILGDDWDNLMRVVPTSPEYIQANKLDGALLLNGKTLEEHNTFSDFYKNRGKEVHAMIQCYIESGSTDFSFYSDDAKPFMTGFYEFVQDHSPLWDASEISLYNNRLGYACTADFTCTIDGAKTVVDVKTGKMHKWHGIQVESQRACLLDEGFTHGKILYLRDKIDEETKKYYTLVDTTADDLDLWHSFLKVYNFKVAPKTRKLPCLRPNLMGEPNEKNKSQ